MRLHDVRDRGRAHRQSGGVRSGSRGRRRDRGRNARRGRSRHATARLVERRASASHHHVGQRTARRGAGPPFVEVVVTAEENVYARRRQHRCQLALRDARAAVYAVRPGSVVADREDRARPLLLRAVEIARQPVALRGVDMVRVEHDEVRPTPLEGGVARRGPRGREPEQTPRLRDAGSMPVGLVVAEGGNDGRDGAEGRRDLEVPLPG